MHKNGSTLRGGTWHKCRDPREALREELVSLDSRRGFIEGKIATIKAAIAMVQSGEWEFESE